MGYIKTIAYIHIISNYNNVEEHKKYIEPCIDLAKKNLLYEVILTFKEPLTTNFPILQIYPIYKNAHIRLCSLTMYGNSLPTGFICH